MNPLETNPHLFANTKFKALVDERDVYPILGVIANTSLYLEDAMLEDTYCIRIKRCQLIARKIESLTNKEVDIVYPWDSEIRRQILKNRSREGYLNREPFLKLLELGVYPFDQQDFGDTVIDTRTLTNA